MYQNLEFEKIKSGYLNDIPEIKSLFKNIQDFYDKLNKKIDRCTPKYQTTVKSILDSFPINEKEDLNGNKIYYINNNLVNNNSQIIESLKQYIDKFESIEYLSFLSEENKNVVFVGPNGCGKTTLLRKLQNDTANAKIQYFQADRVLLVEDTFQPKRIYGEFVKDMQENYKHATNIEDRYQGSYIQAQFGFYINLLEMERRKEMENRIYDGPTTKILNEWKNLVKDRELYFDYELSVRTLDGISYSLKYLSSGEKSILYFLIGVLLQEEKEYYFIDEPENNLNPAIVSLLWDFIERNRPNSIFVYLTHDSNFVASRINSKIYWIKKYDGKQWKWEELKENEFMPQKLLVELVGNRAPVIFCESHDNEKYDAKLFNILFSGFKIVSVSGCDRVCNLTKSYNSLGLPNNAYGIIDRDYKDENWLEKLKHHNVFHISFHEIENLLVCEDFVKLIIKKHYDTNARDNIFETIKTEIQRIFVNNKERFITQYTAFEIRNNFNYKGKIKALNNLNELKLLYKEEKLSDREIDEKAKKYTEMYEKIMTENCYNTYLKFLDCKGVINQIQKILNLPFGVNYDEELFEILKSEECDGLTASLKEEILCIPPNV